MKKKMVLLACLMTCCIAIFSGCGNSSVDATDLSINTQHNEDIEDANSVAKKVNDGDEKAQEAYDFMSSVVKAFNSEDFEYYIATYSQEAKDALAQMGSDEVSLISQVRTSKKENKYKQKIIESYVSEEDDNVFEFIVVVQGKGGGYNEQEIIVTNTNGEWEWVDKEALTSLNMMNDFSDSYNDMINRYNESLDDFFDWSM